MENSINIGKQFKSFLLRHLRAQRSNLLIFAFSRRLLRLIRSSQMLYNERALLLIQGGANYLGSIMWTGSGEVNSKTLFVRNSRSTCLTLYHETEQITRQTIHAFTGIRLFQSGILFHYHLFTKYGAFFWRCDWR